MTPEQIYTLLTQTLQAVGFAPGERFELAAKLPAGMRAATFTDPNQAADWLAQHGSADLYYGLNPVKLDAQPPNGRVRNEDVAVARALLFDFDPAHDTDPQAREAAIAMAGEALLLIQQALGVTPFYVDSGRGNQLVIKHAPLDPSDQAALSIRKELLTALGQRLARPGAKVDLVVANVSRLARLPLGVNGKTGAVPQILGLGDGGVASADAMQALVTRLDSERERSAPVTETSPQPQAGQEEESAQWQTNPPPQGPPPGPPPQALVPDPRLATLATLMNSLPPGPATSLWFGAQAQRVGVAATARGVVPASEQPQYDQGVAVALANGRLPRPLQNDTLLRAVKRALEALAMPPTGQRVAESGLEIREIVHRLRANSLGGEFDLEVASTAGAAVVRGLSGSALRSYQTVADRAAEVGLLLPADVDLEAWLAVLEEPFAARKVIALPDATEVESAIEDEVRTCMRTMPRGESVADLDTGHVWELDGVAVVSMKSLVRGVRRALSDDPPKRAEILKVVASLGAELDRYRRLPPEGKKRSVAIFPLEEGEAGSP